LPETRGRPARIVAITPRKSAALLLRRMGFDRPQRATPESVGEIRAYPSESQPIARIGVETKKADGVSVGFWLFIQGQPLFATRSASCADQTLFEQPPPACRDNQWASSHAKTEANGWIWMIRVAIVRLSITRLLFDTAEWL